PLSFAHQIGFVGLEPVNGKAVFLRVDGHVAQSQFRCRAEDADGNFAPVGHQQFLEAWRGLDGTSRWGGRFWSGFAQTHSVARVYKPAGRGWQRNDDVIIPA